MKPPILIGYDAQPIENFDRMRSLGANALHRYEATYRSIPLTVWIDEAVKRGFYLMIQGTAADTQNVPLGSLHPNVLSICQDDEPDLNRYNDAHISKMTPAEKGAYLARIYTPENAPHPSNIGWTQPSILQERYARWKKQTTLPIVVNFAGPNINSGYYRDDLKWHKAYMGAADTHSHDLYPKNFNGDGGHLYWPANVTDKINAAGGKCLDAYVECAFGGTGFKRGPTPSEQSVMVWSLLGHGVRNIWYFPQKIGGGFAYWNVNPENEAQMLIDNTTIIRHSNLIATGVLTVTQDPKVKNSQYTIPYNTLVWPNTEVFTWSGANGEKLVANVNYVGADVKITHTPPLLVELPPKHPSNDDKIKKLEQSMAENQIAIKALVDGVRAITDRLGTFITEIDVKRG